MLLRGLHWAHLASRLDHGHATAIIREASGDGGHSRDGGSHVLDSIAAAFAEAPGDGQRLLHFAMGLDLAVEVFDVPGGFLAMSNIAPFEGGQERVTASGKGFDAARSVLACLGEAAEISSWACRAVDLADCVGPASLGDGTRIDAANVLGFSSLQVGNRDRLNRAWNGWDVIPAPAHLVDPGLWRSVETFHGDRSAFCPAFLCLGRFGDMAFGDPSLNVDSNGCAAGSTREDARKRALLELVERDATGIWWHRGCVRTRLDIAGLGDPALPAHVGRHREETGRRLWLLDISSFRAARVVAAISCEDSGEGMAVGFGAGFSMVKAARSAFLELIQSEAALQAHEERRKRAKPGPAGAQDCRIERWKRFGDVRNFRFATGQPADFPSDAGECQFEDLLAEIETGCGQPVWFADLSRPDIAVPVAKAICEGLSHFKVRLGCARNASSSLASHPSRTLRGLSEARKLLI